MPPKFPAVIMFPWEQDSMLGRLLRGEQLLDGAVVVPRDPTTAGGLLSKDEVIALARDQSELPSSSAPMESLSLSLPGKRAKLGKSAAPKASDAGRRNEAVLALLSILMMAPAATKIGQKLLEAISPKEKIDLVRVCIIKQRTNTLLARLAAINMFVKWGASQKLLWPPDEDSLWRYMRANCSSADPATRAQSILSAARFWQYTFKGSMGELLESPILEDGLLSRCSVWELGCNVTSSLCRSSRLGKPY